MNNEKDSLSVTYERVRKVFGQTKVAHQMEAGFDMLLERALQRNKPNPVPEIEIVGIYEMVTQHAWDSSLTVLSGNSSPSQTPSSTTSESPEQKSPRSSSPAQKMPKQLHDLQNLPEDPVLGAVRANEEARRNANQRRAKQDDDDIFPDVMPKRAQLIARLEWTTEMTCPVAQIYYLSSNRYRSHWILWVKVRTADDGKTTDPEPVCGIERGQFLRADSAIHLMTLSLRSEMFTDGTVRFDVCKPGHLIDAEELEDIARNVWPSYGKSKTEES